MVALSYLYGSRGTRCGAKKPTRVPDAAEAEVVWRWGNGYKIFKIFKNAN